ncbi:MAG: D-alanine--D-alanine ligase, partial [Nitrosomonas sp.]
LDPSFAVGGWLPSLDTNAASGKGEYFVAEADESDGTFLRYRPFGGIITNIDLDHMNHFGTENKLVNAFGKFAKSVTSTQHLFWCGDDALTKKLSPLGVAYGFNAGNSLRASHYRHKEWGGLFDVQWADNTYSDVEIALPGLHNALNALAVFGLALSIGVPEAAIREAFKSFPGVKRRCERKSDKRGVLILDDYAHHPTEISAVLAAIRGAVGDRRIIAVFQPHRFTRTKHCMGHYKRVFEAADEVMVTDIYAANEEPMTKVTPQAIVKEVTENSSVPTRYVPRNSLRTILTATVRPHDVIVTLGAGDITHLGGELADHFADQSPKRLTVAVICGGVSAEHEVSCMSAKQIIPNVKNDLYELKLFGITKEGRWIFGDDVLDKLANAPKPSAEAQKSSPLSNDVLTQLVTCDVVIPVFHGPNGEDGTLQGFLEVLGKAYVGCDHRSSAISMDKVATKQIAQAVGIPVAPFVTMSAYDWRTAEHDVIANIEKKLQWPLYVKPRHLGSSIGVHKAVNIDDLRKTVNSALRIDTHVVVESEMIMRELEFAIIGNQEAVVLPPGEIFSQGQLHTYEGKYSANSTPDSVKADLPTNLLEEGKALALQAYRAVGCSGLARIDMFLDGENKLWLNEVNPMPGFTPNSMFPRLCIANDMPLADLINRLIILALARRRNQLRLAV